MLTYGDGLANIDLAELLKFHKEKKKTATVTSIQPAGRFGSLDINENNDVVRFIEKPKGDGHWINGGFFVLEPDVFNYLNEDSDDIMWEDEPLEKLAQSGQLAAYKHNGFWKCMDAVRDRIELEQLWQSNHAKWKIWK
jgi:glucose-1-phosphate cytidylyltransferase